MEVPNQCSIEERGRGAKWEAANKTCRSWNVKDLRILDTSSRPTKSTNCSANIQDSNTVFPRNCFKVRCHK